MASLRPLNDAIQSGCNCSGGVVVAGYVAFRSPAPLPLLVNPTAAPGYSARPDQNACEGRWLDAACQCNAGDGGIRRCIGSALGVWDS